MIPADLVFFKNAIKSILRRIERIESALDELLKAFRALDDLGAITCPGYPLRDHLEHYEADVIRATLKKHDWNKDATAQALGFTPSELAIRIKTYKIETHDPDAEKRLELERNRLRQERFLGLLLD